MKKRIADIQFRVGFFIFLGLIIFFVFVFSQGKILQRKGYNLKIVYNYVAVLDPGAPVRVSGYRVGEVKNISLSMEQEKPQIIVTVRIKPEIRLGRHSRFMVRSYGIIGEKYMEIMPTGLKDVPLIEPEETVRGEDPLPIERFISAGEDILRNLNSLLVSLNSIIRDENLKTEISQIAQETKNLLSKASISVDNFNHLASTWNTTSSEINSTIVAIRPELKQFISNINTSSREINSIITGNRDKIERVITNFDRTLSELDKTLLATSEQFKAASEAFVKTNNKISGLVEKIESQGLFSDLITDTEIAKDIRDTFKSLKKTSTDLNISLIKLGFISDQIAGVLSDIRSGKGTVGKLIEQDELYNQIFEMVQDLKAHPWKILFRGKEK